MSRESRIHQRTGRKSRLSLARVAARQWSVSRRGRVAQVRAVRQAVLKRVQAGRLHPLYRGCLRLGPPTPLARRLFLAAVKACGEDAVLSHFSAACLLVSAQVGLPRPGGDRADAARTRGHPRPTEPAHRADIPQRHPRHPPLRTLIDLSSMLPYATLRRAVNEALNQRLVKPHELVTANHRGAKQLREVVASGAPHEKRVRRPRPRPPRRPPEAASQPAAARLRPRLPAGPSTN